MRRTKEVCSKEKLELGSLPHAYKVDFTAYKVEAAFQCLWMQSAARGGVWVRARRLTNT